MKENTFKINSLLKYCLIFTLIGTVKIFIDFGFSLTPWELHFIQIGLIYFYGMVLLIYISLKNNFKKTGIFLCIFLGLNICHYLYMKSGWNKYTLTTKYGDTLIIKEQRDFGFPSERYEYFVYDKKSKNLLGTDTSKRKLDISKDKIKARENKCKNLDFDEKVKYIYTIDNALTITKDVKGELGVYPLGYE